MEDTKIIDLYLKRSEDAITETDKKYRGYLNTITNNILCSKEDSEECINDTYLKTWNSIPLTIPKILCAYLGKISRNLALSVYNRKNRIKRGRGEITLVLEELQECIKSNNDIESEIEKKELTKILNNFIIKLSNENREIFIRRYWYMESISKIAEKLKVSESKIKSTLFRLRKKLIVILEEYDMAEL